MHLILAILALVDIFVALSSRSGGDIELPRSGGIPVLAPSEELLWQGEIRDTTVTNLRLIVTKGAWLQDVLLGAVYSVELTQSFAIVNIGLFVAVELPLLIALLLKYMDINIDFNSILWHSVYSD